MRLKIILALSVISGALLAWNLHTMFLKVPDEANQGAIFRIFYFHFPAAITSFTGFYLGMFAGVGYLIRNVFGLHASAPSSNEVWLAFSTIALVTASIGVRCFWRIL